MILVMFIMLFGMSSDGVALFGPLAVDDFDKLNDNYYRGGQPKRDDFARLAALGIKAVVNSICGRHDAGPNLAVFAMYKDGLIGGIIHNF